MLLLLFLSIRIAIIVQFHLFHIQLCVYSKFYGVYPSGAPECILGFEFGSCCYIFGFLCNVLFIILLFLFWSLCYLSFIILLFLFWSLCYLSFIILLFLFWSLCYLSFIILHLQTSLHFD